MKDDKIFKRDINGHEVWVTVTQPSIFDEEANAYVKSSRYCVAYKIGLEPIFIDGEYLKTDGQLIWFNTEEKAVRAAFEQASGIISKSR